MPERTLTRIGAAAAVLGAVLGLVVNVLLPRVSDPANTKAFLRQVAESTIWVGDHVGIFFAMLLVTGGLVAVYRSITSGPGAAWARLGFAAALVSAGLGFVTVAVEGIAVKRVAMAWASAPKGEKAVAFRVADALVQIQWGLDSVWILIFFGATFILYGVAVILSDVYPKWLGWVAAGGGLGSSIIGLHIGYHGASSLVFNVLFPIFSILLTAWIFMMGILLWRRSG
jgi:hypothetical protein